MTLTTRFGLPLIATGQAQKDVTHNTAIHEIDRLMHLRVESRSLADPPASSVIDATWIVADAAQDGWAGNDGAFARWDGGAWVFSQPADGTLCWIADEKILAVYGDGAWNGDFLPVAGIRAAGHPMLGNAPVTIAAPLGGSVVDTEARAVLTALIGYLETQGLLTS